MSVRYLWLVIILLSFGLVANAARQPFTFVVHPKGGNASLLLGEILVADIGYYDWGPGWSGVKRRVTGTEQDGQALFRYDNIIQQTRASFVVDGSWRQISDKQLAFEATLLPAASSALVQSQFSIKPHPSELAKRVRYTEANGKTSSTAIPVPRGKWGEDVTRIELPSEQGAIVVEFESPTAIYPDRGDIRMVLAHSQMTAGKSERLAFTLTFPSPVKFLSGPKAASAASADGAWYPFHPPMLLPASSELRLDEWLPSPAGKLGRIAQRGDQLIYGDKPVKLWGINNSYAQCAPDRGLAKRRAHFYAAMGINSVRLHKYADGPGWAGILSERSAKRYDEAALGRMDYFVSALKDEGIFVKLSPVFIADIGPDDLAQVPYAKELGKPNKNGWISVGHGAFFLGEEIQDLLIEQVTNLLYHTNPYTGLTYAEDPAIAFIELYNEDSALFYGTNKVLAQSPTLRNRAGKQFYDWLAAKYGSEAALRDAWGRRALNNGMLANQKIPKDESWADKRIYPVGNPWFYDPTNLNGSQRFVRQRLLDTMQFLSELQNTVYARYGEALRKAGYDGELVASNWQAGRMMSHFYNLHSDALVGMVDRHNYFGGGTRGSGPFNAASMLSSPGSGMLSSGLQQVAGRPFMLSEWIHVFPNEWGAEGVALIGAYGMGLQGWDVSYPFQNGDKGSFTESLGQQWDVTAPQVIGLFPAVSRQVHRGDVSESKVVHYRNVHVDSLPAQKLGFTESVEQTGDIKRLTSNVFPAAALAVAKSQVRFTSSYQETASFDVDPYREDNDLVSSTGQLRWRGGESSQSGFITIDTPGTQAVVGFAAGETIVLSDATLEPASRFSALYLSAQSVQGSLANDSILITAMARARNADQLVVNDSVLLDKGSGSGIVLEPVRAKVTMNSERSFVVHALDHGGSQQGKTLPIESQSFFIDTGHDQTPYYLLEYISDSSIVSIEPTE